MKLSAVILCLLSTLQAADELVHISGTVVHGVSKQNLSGAHVYLTPRNNAEPLSVVTKADGRFEFTIPAGRYSLAAEAPDMQRQNFGGRNAPPEIAVSIIARQGLPTEDLIFPLFPAASMKGKIVDENGDPVEDALVHLIRKTAVAGKASTTSYRWGRTDDRGEYRFGLVVPGTYYLAVNAKPWYADGNPRVRPVGVNSTTVGSECFVPSYYPGTADLSQAAPIVLNPGQQARGDFTLVPAKGAKITVHCATCSNSGTLQLIYDGIGHVEEFQQTAYIYNGNGTLPAVPPGQYYVRVFPDQSTQAQAASGRIDVQGSDLTVELNSNGMPSVSGSVTIDGGALPPRGLTVRVIHMASGRTTNGAVGANGNFQITAVRPGLYQILAIGAGLYTKSVHIGERETKVLDVSDEGVSNVRMVAATGGGSVSGVVYRDGKPLYGVLAVLTPEGLPTNEPDRYRSFKTDSDGSFEWTNLPPGTYRLFAVDRYDFEYKVPDIVRPFLKGSKLVEIGSGDTFHERIDLSNSN
jgi:Carboxypeptidase regulatory-like domain